MDMDLLSPVAFDGHRWALRTTNRPEAVVALLWLPAMGVPARNYDAFAATLAGSGVAVAVHEWRGLGSSSLRAGRHCDWGYRELLESDLPASLAALRAARPELPLMLGGHSLGGQLACLFAASRAEDAAGLLVVASGTPHRSGFAGVRGAALPAAYRLAAALAHTYGHFPGRRVGFGGREARGVIADWSRSGRSGIYRAAGMDEDLEAKLRAVRLPMLGVVLRDDWLAPQASLANLIAKMPQVDAQVAAMGPEELGVAADHFAWMRAPDAVAHRIGAWLQERGIPLRSARCATP
nr:alpha/beta hydrolase [Coralloluteibacterium stylophorae]